MDITVYIMWLQPVFSDSNNWKIIIQIIKGRFRVYVDALCRNYTTILKSTILTILKKEGYEEEVQPLRKTDYNSIIYIKEEPKVI